MKSPILSCAIILTLGLGALRAAYADSATWNLSPVDGNWNNAANWTPATVPNGPSDTATFAASNLTAISFSANSVEVAAVVFDVGASAFNIVADPAVTFNITGTGIINNSGVTQNFTVAPSANTHIGTIDFQNAATVGDGTVLTVYGAETFGVDGGLITFHDTATAANATLISYGALTGHEVGGGVFAFFGSSTAGNAHFEINGALASGGFGGGATFNDEASAGNAVFVLNAPAAPNRDAGGVTFRGNATAANGAFTLNGATNTNFNFGEPQNITFEDGATADHGLFTVNGGQEPDTFGCSVTFGFTSGGLIISAGHATLINNGGQAANADGGGTTFLGSTTAEQAHLIANGGANGGEGGHIYFFSDADGGEAQLELFGNGVLNVSFHNLPGVTIGSLAGDGFVYTGALPHGRK